MSCKLPAGGFRDAALCLLEGAESAELQAISRVAEHRLARGIWTSPGAGDLRRALAAAQRLAILVSLIISLAVAYVPRQSQHGVAARCAQSRTQWELLKLPFAEHQCGVRLESVLGRRNIEFHQAPPLLRAFFRAWCSVHTDVFALLHLQFGDASPVERRDVAVLLMHAQQSAQARVELRAYDASPTGQQAPAEESSLVARLLQQLDDELGAGQDDPPLLSLQSAMAQPPPAAADDSRQALSW